MKRRAVLLLLVLLAVVAAGCGGDDDSAASSTTTAPTSTIETTAAPVVTTMPGSIGLDEIEVDIPELWRMVGSPPEGADVAIYAPSDNNPVAERLLLTAVPLDAAATEAARVEEATNDLEAHYVAVVPLGTARTSVGTDARPAQVLRFTWEQPREAGVGWRWVFPADTELIYVTFLADLSEPQLYLSLIEDMLATARIGA